MFHLKHTESTFVASNPFTNPTVRPKGHRGGTERWYEDVSADEWKVFTVSARFQDRRQALVYPGLGSCCNDFCLDGDYVLAGQ
ncbi:hypothetical protein AGR1B_pTi0210 [Agrobacterium fabacearum S56]|uniref:Uncharacterized protein n=1 Tax=Agrobacterium deltaense Zutra 3/1 TaxID=1183427 RepID=A0A1S7S543_9HYPH|nr:hypothetical protein AGR1B_pTi0210 [Agrobacterium fabacearum S56]CUX62850.1 hypothetical protein AGR7C_pTi0044 [Agrobacterium deltaense Zutra 3/1]